MRTHARALLAAGVVGAAAIGAPLPAAAASPPVSVTYQLPPGGPFETFVLVLPDDVCAVSFEVVGAGGGAGFQGEPSASPIPGGAGASVAGVLPVAPGSTLHLNVGGAGGAGASGVNGSGGVNGGGPGGSSSGGGGGASDIRLGGTGLADRVVVAGGGGGGTFFKGPLPGTAGWGGAGGQTGSDGVPLGPSTPLGGGQGGSATAGGTGGTSSTGIAGDGTAGGGGQGGTGAGPSIGTGAGGGGGAGLFGGGGGSSGGGGGGSSAAATATGVVITTPTDPAGFGAPGIDGVIQLDYVGDPSCELAVPLVGGWVPATVLALGALVGAAHLWRSRPARAGG